MTFAQLHRMAQPIACRGLFNKEAISKMKKGAYLINNARGAIVERQAIVDACNSGQLAGLPHSVQKLCEFDSVIQCAG